MSKNPRDPRSGDRPSSRRDRNVRPMPAETDAPDPSAIEAFDKEGAGIAAKE
jgi:hypothetical protein